MRVLVTGAAGAIGRPVCLHLAQRGHAVTPLDRLPCGPESLLADILDPAAMLAACAGMDALVHLAAVPDEAPFLQLVTPNVVGLFNVLDAARQQRVQRVFLASSVQVGWGHEEPTPRRATTAEPQNHYALTKLWAEQMGEMYARCFGLSVVAGRIGWMVRDEREAIDIQSRGMQRHYVSRRDTSHFIERALEAPGVSYATLYVVGPDGKDLYDLDTPRQLLGYEPQDYFPAGLPCVISPD